MNKKIFTALASAAAFAVVSLTPLAAQAEPLPTDCHHGYGWQTDYTWARCDKGAGSVRAIATCSNGRTKKTVYGPWKGIRVQSSAHCPDTYPKAVSHSYDIKR
ncbi:MAG: hypothetical protein K0R62_3536 [Nonomuraea muscovyensis]|jgi:hypothetical protein|nr:hypothetical protein [Nonomuraea muscovyensis]